MPPVATITETQILEALRAAFKEQEVDDAALTTYEMAKAWSVSPQTAGRRVRALCETGKLECVTKMCVDRTGRVFRPQPAYRLSRT